MCLPSTAPTQFGKFTFALILSNLEPCFVIWWCFEVHGCKITANCLTNLSHNVAYCRNRYSKLKAQRSVTFASCQKSYCERQSLSSSYYFSSTAPFLRCNVGLNSFKNDQEILVSHLQHVFLCFCVFDHQLAHDVVEVTLRVSSPNPCSSLSRFFSYFHRQLLRSEPKLPSIVVQAAHHSS